MNYLHDWVFHYNTYTNKWEATTRDNYTQLFSGGDKVLRTTKFESLLALLTKAKGDINKAFNLIK